MVDFKRFIDNNSTTFVRQQGPRHYLLLTMFTNMQQLTDYSKPLFWPWSVKYFPDQTFFMNQIMYLLRGISLPPIYLQLSSKKKKRVTKVGEGCRVRLCSSCPHLQSAICSQAQELLGVPTTPPQPPSKDFPFSSAAKLGPAIFHSFPI